jgi:hypothetical protein
MRRTTVVVAALTLALAACGWTQVDFDAGHSRANSLETKLTASTIASLQLHSIPLATSTSDFAAPALRAVVGNQIITQQGTDVVAYDTATCPRSDNGPCTPLWTRSGAQFRGSDGSHLVFAPGTSGSTSGPSFEVTDSARRHLWDGFVPNPTTPDETLGITSITLSGDKLVAGAMGGSHGSYDEKVGVFPLGGCGSAICAPAHLFDNGDDGHGNRWRVSGNTLVVNAAPSEPVGLHAFDLTSGAEQWSAAGDFDLADAQIRGSDLFVQQYGAAGLPVFDLAGHAGCSGMPVTCAAIRVIDTADGLIPWDASTGDRTTVLDGLVDNGNGTATHRLSFFAADGTGCPSSPCAPIATTSPVTTWSTQGSMLPVTAGDVVLALGVPPAFTNRTYHLLAYDAKLSTGCGGSPKVCAPLADLTITGQSDAYPGPIVVWAGRVYVHSGSALYVFSLPGDVS